MKNLLFIFLLFLSCDAGNPIIDESKNIIVVDGTSEYEYNLYAELIWLNQNEAKEDIYIARFYGDIKNNSDSNLSIVPVAEIFFTWKDYIEDKPSITSVGEIGYYNSDVWYMVVVEKFLKPKQILNYLVRTNEFIIPDTSDYVSYRIRFEKNG